MPERHPEKVAPVPNEQHRPLGEGINMAKITLPFLNCEQLPCTRCQQAAAAPGEFKKLVYESKFRKLAK
jgi:hypothetical protein